MQRLSASVENRWKKKSFLSTSTAEKLKLYIEGERAQTPEPHSSDSQWHRNRGSGGSMNRGPRRDPELLGPPSSGATEKF